MDRSQERRAGGAAAGFPDVIAATQTDAVKAGDQIKEAGQKAKDKVDDKNDD